MAATKSARRLTKVSGKLKGVAEAKASPTLLVKDVQKHVHDKAMAEERDQLHIHPSEMAKEDWCPRQTFLRIQHYRQGGERLSSGRSYSFQMQNIFENGNEIHRKWQGWLGEMGRLYGKWTKNGKTLFETTLTAEEYASGGWKYREIPLEDPEHLMIGHADGGVEDLSALIEIKGIGTGTLRYEEPEWLSRFLVETVDGKKIYDLDQAWKELRAPLKSHIKQANFYGWMCKVRGLPFDRVVFIYEYKANQGVKEFTVKFNERLIERELDLAKDIKWRLDNDKQAPRKPEHTGPDVKVCKECPFYKECWDGASTEDEDAGRDPGTGRRVAGRQAKARTPGAGRTGEARSGAARSSRRPDRPGRQRTDDAVQQADPVDELSWRATGGGRGGRAIRKRGAGQAQGAEADREQHREDGDGGEG